MDVIYAECTTRIGDHCLQVDLISLDMLEFDAILRINWLVACHASIDCAENLIRFNPLEHPPFKFQGIGSRVSPPIISALHARHLLLGGGRGFLACVSMETAPQAKLKEISVVCEFADVFSDELPDLAPEREDFYGFSFVLCYLFIAISKFVGLCYEDGCVENVQAKLCSCKGKTKSLHGLIIKPFI
ncbi:hypothetical protein Nepgr_010701 [Nepenthes gracilis]|uniref:Uncharacterized protein n=1 Tax=Nepenthes gracilis TaxID=150966 RepID=A0AAD3SDQ6_NEPGR|nr:hypothetical protein Nepgr_010701 [Nepenthes gracilis]